jgi:hypothetical protein
MYRRNWNVKPAPGTIIVPTQDSLAEGLVLALAFNEQTGKTAFDASLSGNNGTLGSLASWSSDTRGPVLALPGSSNSGNAVSCGNGASLKFGTGPFSAFARFTVNNGSATQYIMAYGSSGVLWYMRINGATQLLFAAGSTALTTTVSTIVNSSRHTIAMVRDAAGNLTGYFDGVKVGSGTGFTGTVNGSGGLSLGADIFGGANFFGGSLDCAFVANRAWSAGEVADLHVVPFRAYRSVSPAIPAAFAPGIASVTPPTLYANNTTTVAVVGYGTTWPANSTNTFSLSGAPAGTTIASQSVTDATHASVTIQSGATTGSFQLSDGSHTFGMSVAPDSLVAVPATIPAHHGGNLTLTLTGAGTNWQQGVTTFTPSGVTGVAKVSQNIASATSATLVITTGSGTGTLMISDGSVSTTIQVQAATLAITPTAGASTGNFGLTLTGTNTVWTQETASTLFSASGVDSPSIAGASIAVQSDTHATGTLAISGNTAGAVMITDNSVTGSTATFTAEAAPSGSLHITAPLILSRTGGGASLFGGQASAWFAFRLKVNSNAGLNLTSGTQVLDFAGSWTTTYAVTYFPATGTLQVFVGGPSAASNSAQRFLAKVPVQLGIDYHFLLAWSNGSQTLYVNGIPHTTTAIATATYAYGAVQFGGNAGVNIGGAPQAMDHALADIPMGNGYVPTAIEALALAGGTMSPLQLATPALAWWPLGGGTIGTNPVSNDLTTAWGYLADFTGNGNTLSVATTTPASSLSNATYAAAIPMASPILVSAAIDKTGKWAVFEAAGAAQVNGVNPPAPILSINADPTLHRNGSGTVQTGSRVSYPQTGDTPHVMYLLQCGGVKDIAIVDGGAGYTSPSIAVNNTGTGGSGLALGTPVLQAGVTGYTLTNAGSGYGQPPAVVFSAPGGGTTAQGYAVTYGAFLAGVVVTNPGSGYTSAPTVTFNYAGVTGSGAAATATISGGAVTGVTMTSFGSGHAAPPSVTVGAPPNTGGPAGNIAAGHNVVNGVVTGRARAIVYGPDAAAWGGTPGAIRAIVPWVGGLIGCGQGYTTAPAVTISAPGGTGTQATATAVVSGYIASIPVTSQGSNFNSPPTFTITDAGATRTAVLRPIMTGAAGFAASGTTASGSASVTGLASTAAMQVGQSVSGSGIPAGATIQAINSGTAITLSANATAAGTPSLWIADVLTYDAPASFPRAGYPPRRSPRRRGAARRWRISGGAAAATRRAPA